VNQGTNSLAEQGINVAAEATARGISWKAKFTVK
jgi:hypothetical protein